MTYARGRKGWARPLSTIVGSSKITLLASLALGAVNGCSAAPSEPSRAPLSPSADEARSHARHGFDPVHIPKGSEPDPLRPGPTSLRDILVYADRHAPRLSVARQRLGLGDAAREAAGAALPANPELTVAAGPRFGPAGTALDVRAGLSQRLEIAGERGLRIAAAERSKERYRAELDEARWEIHRDVHSAFHRALVARERHDAQNRLVVFEERLVDIARGRVKAGEVGPLVIRLAEGELAQARVAAIAAEQDYVAARLELGATAGWPPAHPPEPAGELDAPRDPPSLETLVAQAWRHQPRLRSLETARAEAEARAEAASRDGWPEPTIGVEVAREGAPAGMSETIVVGTLTVPLPFAHTNQGAIAETRATLAVVEAEQRAFGSQLDAAVARHRGAVVAAARRVRAYGGQILPSFEESLRLIQRAYELGEIDILQVSVAREQFLRMQADALDAYADYFGAVADLEATTGTDLWPDERHEPASGSSEETP